MTSDDGDSRWEHCHLAAVPAQRCTCSSNGLGSAAPVHAATSKQIWCLTSRETIRFIRDREKGGMGYGGGGRGRL